MLNTNSKGLRGNREFDYGKHPDKQRVLIMGDSFTFGDEVSDNLTYAHYLQELMPYAEIMNMGVPGYGHDQMLISLREEGIKYRPDVVILGYERMDMERNLLQFRTFAKPKFQVRRGKLELIGTPVPMPDDVARWDWARPRIYDFWSVLKYHLNLEYGSLEKQRESITKHILSKFISVSKHVGAMPILVYLPVNWEIKDQRSIERSKDNEKFFHSICRENSSARCFSARSHFAAKLRQGAEFKWRGHWNALGHQTVAEAIHDYLIAQKIITAPKSKPIVLIGD